MNKDDVSFSNPFFNQISKYPVRFATPVFFGESPYSSYAAGLSNGTATLVKLQNRFLGVTCQHVLQGYRRARMNPGIIFQIGHAGMDPEEYLVGESSSLDLAIIDLTSFVGRVPDLAEASFVEPKSWPPRDVSTDDILCLAGFPGIWREQKGPGYLRFYSFSSGSSEVRSVTENQIVTRVQLQDCITEVNDGKVLGSLGGLSGGPVFAWRKTSLLAAELVGFIYEYQESLDLLLVRAARVVREDGSVI